jgi:hypothetical protein
MTTQETPTLTITETELSNLQVLLAEAKDIARQKEALEARDDENRAKLLELMGRYIPEDASGGAEVIDGVTVKIDTKVDYDAKQALAWTLDPSNIRGGAAFLAVRPTMVATVVELVLANNLNPSGVFDLNKTGYAAGVREGTHIGMPVNSVTRKKTLTLKPAAFKFGSDLAVQFDIVEEASATAQTEIA